MQIHLLTIEEAFKQVQSRGSGLTAADAAARLALQRANRRTPRGNSAVRLLLNQFRSPLVVLLLAAMVLSFVLGDKSDALIVLAIVLLSTLLGFSPWCSSSPSSPSTYSR